MSTKRIRGLSVAVDDVDAASGVLATLGFSPVDLKNSGAGSSVWMSDRHFIALNPKAGNPVIHAAGLDGGTTAAGVRFEPWPHAEPSSPGNGGGIIGIDHVISVVDSIEAGAAQLAALGVYEAEVIREFPAISTRARMHKVGEAYLELNEPLGAGPTAWGEARGIVGLVLETADLDACRAGPAGAILSRTSEVHARQPGRGMETLGVVSIVKTRAFGSFQLYVYQPFIR